MQDEIIADEVKKDIEQCVATAAGSITKCLQVHEWPEGRVEKIYDGYELVSKEFHERI